ncbi:hypothetical protein [Hoeflea phototrophica]|uniref:hypothetical protein n=1 Tax=Hoeflea phototrophica TaxID=244596 RepID=UPI0012EC0AB9|nr:hypothetical protein [Hoeflea phototrophica]
MAVMAWFLVYTGIGSPVRRCAVLPQRGEKSITGDRGVMHARFPQPPPDPIMTATIPAQQPDRLLLGLNNFLLIQKYLSILPRSVKDFKSPASRVNAASLVPETGQNHANAWLYSHGKRSIDAYALQNLMHSTPQI